MKTKQALNGEFPVARSRLGSGWGGGQRPPPAKRGMFTTVVDPLVTASGLSSSLDADMDAAIDDPAVQAAIKVAIADNAAGRPHHSEVAYLLHDFSEGSASLRLAGRSYPSRSTV